MQQPAFTMENPKYDTIMGLKTRYFDEGEGKPILLIGGGDYDYRQVTSATDWIVTFSILKEHFRVIAHDKVGSGESDSPSEDRLYTKQYAIDHTKALIDKLGLEKLTVFGHSRGGLIALNLAARFPELIERVIISNSTTAAGEDPALLPDHLCWTRKYPTQDAVPTDEIIRGNLQKYVRDGVPGAQEFFAVKWYEHKHRHPDRPLTQEAISRMVENNNAYLFPDVLEVKYSTYELIRKQGLKQPVMLLWGLNDPTCPASLGFDFFKYLSRYAPHAELHMMANSGHKPQLDQSDRVHEFVEGFIANTRIAS